MAESPVLALARQLIALPSITPADAGCLELIAGRLFDLPLKLHPWLWLVLPAAGALLVGASGWLTTRHITRVPPMQSIRALN